LRRPGPSLTVDRPRRHVEEALVQVLPTLRRCRLAKKA
jgi:hypothetical protein